MDHVVVTPAGRRAAVLEVIASAKSRLVLSLYRCDDRRVLEALGAASRRGVRVEALLTRRTGDRSSLRLLHILLEQLGVRVWRYADPSVKYHAKYVVADERTALVGSLNFTHRCFKKTSDFLVVTSDHQVASSLVRLFDTDCHAPSSAVPTGLSPRLIVAPGHARADVRTLLTEARHSIRLVDPKLSDPSMLALLRAKAAAGVRITLLGGPRVAGRRSHGKLLLVDERLALVGSLALSTTNLDERREVALMLSGHAPVAQLAHFFDAAATSDPVHIGGSLQPLASVA
jgi:phosphatidylserine/phosphatidylglycerophosphate/cardiolipin synthase-like enzyme